jgi:hypothetical protein
LTAVIPQKDGSVAPRNAHGGLFPNAAGLPRWRRDGGFAAPAGDPASCQMPDPGMEKQALMSQAEALQSEPERLKKRLSDLETDIAAQ